MSIELNTNTIRTIDELHIIVLVAGTSDPVNTNITTKTKNDVNQPYKETKHRANSYESTSLYWDKYFYEAIKKFQNSSKENKPMIVFDKHGWSGDNSIKNREIAGAYLVNRLCGAEGLKPYYPKYKKSPVTFHLLGHSHGGNVINEMTKQMDKLGKEWPKDWKVKSLTYLSTPFFNEIHQVKVTEKTFHKDAEVLHLYCDFDLTQRLLADFSIEPLARVFISDETKVLGESIKKIQESKISFPSLSSQSLEDIDDNWRVDLEITINSKEGKSFYKDIISLFENIKGVFNSLDDLIVSLSTKIEFNVSESIKEDLGENILSYKRIIIEEKTKESLREIVGLINIELQKNISNFQKRIVKHDISNDKYLFKNIFIDFEINILVNLLLEFLDIDSKTLISPHKSSIWNSLYEILDFNIEKFDDTYVEPDKQFKNTFLKDKITKKDVTSRDEYYGKAESFNYYNFIKRIEEIEKKYNSEPNQTNLLDLIFTLLQQVGVIYEFKGIGFGTMLKTFAYNIKINRWRKLNFKAKEFEKRIFQLANLVKSLETIFRERDFGGLTDKSNEHGPLSEETPGSIPYLLVEAHSTSRRVLHEEVRDFLKRLGAKR